MRWTSLLAVWLVVAIIVDALEAQRRKKKDEEVVTQALEVLPEPPHALVAETRRLVFHLSPLSPKGLLSQQTRDALKALQRQVGGATIVKLRAMVAGSGDLRRIQSIVSEQFTERKQPLPVLSVVQVGALPLEGAQVILESTAVARKEVNPLGLAFISGQAASSDRPLAPAATLAKQSLADLTTALRATGMEPKDMVRISCFMSTLEDFSTVRALVAADYPLVPTNLVQVQRSPARSIVECEGVARLRHKIDEPLKLLNPPGLTASPNYSQVALVAAPRVVLTGAQVSFGYQDSDARLAFQRLEKDLAAVKASVKDVAMSSVYPLSASLADQVCRIRFEFYDKTRPPASTMLPFEGLPAMEAGFGVDVIAVMK